MNTKIFNGTGFKSKATFYSVFKEIESMTPSEFIDTIKK